MRHYSVCTQEEHYLLQEERFERLANKKQREMEASIRRRKKRIDDSRIEKNAGSGAPLTIEDTPEKEMGREGEKEIEKEREKGGVKEKKREKEKDRETEKERESERRVERGMERESIDVSSLPLAVRRNMVAHMTDTSTLARSSESVIEAGPHSPSPTLRLHDNALPLTPLSPLSPLISYSPFTPHSARTLQDDTDSPHTQEHIKNSTLNSDEDSTRSVEYVLSYPNILAYVPPYHPSEGIVLPLLPVLTAPLQWEDRLHVQPAKRIGFTFRGESEGMSRASLSLLGRMFFTYLKYVIYRTLD